MLTSRCYFFWPVLIFGKCTRKTGENTRKQAKNSAFLVLIFLWEKLVGANFYAFCNYVVNIIVNIIVIVIHIIIVKIILIVILILIIA